MTLIEALGPVPFNRILGVGDHLSGVHQVDGLDPCFNLAGRDGPTSERVW